MKTNQKGDIAMFIIVAILAALIIVPTMIYFGVKGYLVDLELKNEEVQIRRLYAQKLQNDLDRGDDDAFDRHIHEHQERQKMLAIITSSQKVDYGSESAVVAGAVAGSIASRRK